MNRELVSIGMPVFNGGQFLEAAIRSNLNQSYPDLELIISDNASTDETESICRTFAEQDSRIKYVRNNTNIGAAKNYNQLFRLATGKYFRWANADDLVATELVERTLAVLESRPDVAIAYGRTLLIDDKDQRIDEYDDNLNLQQERASDRYGQFLQRVGMSNIIYGLMRSSSVARTKLMGAGQLPAGDINFMLAMSLFGKFVEIPETLFYRRMHKGAFSANLNEESELRFWRASTRSVAFPYWRSAFADLTTIARAPISPSEKLRAAFIRTKHMVYERRRLAMEVFRAFLILFPQ